MAITTQTLCNGRAVRVEFESEDEAPQAITELLAAGLVAYGPRLQLEIGGMTPNPSPDGFVKTFELWAKPRTIRK